jgi:DNA polymerase III subunit epsilon
MRQIIFDTETTGLEPEKGHRIIEIGCVELIDRQLTGNSFHCYINPQRKIEADALAIHGITNEFLQDKPIFASILDDFLNFVSGTELIAHNASFDVGFINYEIQLLNQEAKTLESYATIFDTLALARKMFPGQRNSLDALCKRYKVDLTNRKLQGHGALLDARLLSEIYLLMTSGQRSLFAESDFCSTDTITKTTAQVNNLNKVPLPIIYANNEEIIAHEAILTKIKK